MTKGGLFDTNFDTDGKQTVDFGGYYESATSLAFDGDDNVLLAGNVSQLTTGYDFAVARLTSGGLLDNDFDTDGKQTVDFGSTSDFFGGMAIDSHDNVLLAGYSFQGTTNFDFALARLIGNDVPSNVKMTANSVNENGIVNVSGSFADSDSHDTHVVISTWNVGENVRSTRGTTKLTLLRAS